MEICIVDIGRKHKRQESRLNMASRLNQTIRGEERREGAQERSRQPREATWGQEAKRAA